MRYLIPKYGVGVPRIHVYYKGAALCHHRIASSDYDRSEILPDQYTLCTVCSSRLRVTEGAAADNRQANTLSENLKRLREAKANGHAGGNTEVSSA